MNFEPHKANLVAPTIKMYSARNENNGSYLWMKSSLVTRHQLPLSSFEFYNKPDLF